MRHSALLVTFSLAFASIVHAGPVVPEDISHDAKWFGHINIEAINSVGGMQELRAKMGKDRRLQDRIQEVSQRIGMNPMEDLLGGTIYSTQYGAEAGVGLLYMKNVDRKKLLGVLKEHQPDHETSQHGDRAFYSWSVKHRRGEIELTASFASKNLIVIGADKHHVEAALDTIDDEKAGMSLDSSLLAGVARLEFRMDPIDDGRSTKLIMTARFRPKGLLGLLYWYSVVPLHHLVFGGMLRGIKRAAESGQHPEMGREPSVPTDHSI